MFPSIERIVDVQRQVGYAVFVTAVNQGLASPAIEEKFKPLIDNGDTDEVCTALTVV